MSFFSKVLENTAVHLLGSATARVIERAIDNSQELLDSAKATLQKFKPSEVAVEDTSSTEPPVVELPKKKF